MAPQSNPRSCRLVMNWITPERVWLTIGFAGQALFASRFIIQWFKSEMEGRS
ncbi:MAG: lipid-A-disaccharide synthase N-terminal domain-containing protein, partial [Rhizomicrobium sp.]